MKGSLAQGENLVCVLDLETALDEAAAYCAGYKGGAIPPELQKIVTASLLVAHENADGSWTGLDLRSFSSSDCEFDVIMDLLDFAASLTADRGILITYNGTAHDLPVLKRRAARHWMFGLPGLVRLQTMQHTDLMLLQRRGRGASYPTLRDACAGLSLGLPGSRGTRLKDHLSSVGKCESDVVATYLLALYEIAMARGSPSPLRQGWEALECYLANVRPRRAHLDGFVGHPLLRASRRADLRGGSDSLG